MIGSLKCRRRESESQPVDPMATKKAQKGTTAKAKATATKARIKKTKVALAGSDTRVKAHLKSTTKRQQAKRDSKNAG